VNEHFQLALTAEELYFEMSSIRHYINGWVTLRLNVGLKGYIYRQHLWTMVILQLCRWKFHTKKLC